MPIPVTAVLWVNEKNPWQDIDSVLQHFGNRNDSAQKRYRGFVEKGRVLAGGKQQNRVHARSVTAYWAIRYLGLTATTVGRALGLSKSAVSRAAERGRRLVAEQSLTLKE